MTIFETTEGADPLGLWDTSPQTVSFGLGEETSREAAAPVYRVTLSQDEQASSSSLAAQLASIERINTALDEIPSQLDGLVQREQAKRQMTSAINSFSPAETAPEASPESELLSMLAASDTAALSGTTPEGISYGFYEAAGAGLSRAKEQFEALLEQVNHEILHFVWVETKIESLLIARTEVGWKGDSTTIWKDYTTTSQILSHQQTLEIVSLTRNLKLRLLFTVTSGAAKMAVLMAAPGGAVLALPAVFAYVIKILEQVKQIQSVPSV